MQCRICSSSDIAFLGPIRPYLDFSTKIYDCNNCGCRFAFRYESMFSNLHENIDSPYGMHRSLAQSAVELFNDGEFQKLRRFLAASEKNDYILKASDQLPAGAAVLEIGCSLGYLTSYFIAMGFNIIGTDVSQSAVSRAEELFGPHFCLIDDPIIEHNAPYDMIYHAGTIGCVDDPVGLTKYWLSLLKPNGVLVFNAPNKRMAVELRKVWPYTTPPPDLITVFPVSFWVRFFSDECQVNINERFLENYQARLFKRVPTLVLRGKPYLFAPKGALEKVLRVLRFALRKMARLMYSKNQSPIPAEFGMIVTLRKS